MLLAIDVGNTNIVVGVLDGDELVADVRLHTDERATGDELGHLITSLLAARGVAPPQIHAVVIGSVVPVLTRSLHQLAERFFGTEPLLVGPGVRTGMKILIDDPRQVGADRIVNALAAYRGYGGPAIVVDLGTAVNFDVISAQGEYLGGVIAPGLQVSHDALVARAARLSRVDLVAPTAVVGRSTISAMQSGLVFGHVGLIEGLVNRIKVECGATCQVIATGGFAELIAAETRCIDHIDQRLTLDGLRMIYDLNTTD